MDLKALQKLYYALSDEIRIKIIYFLMHEKDICTCDFVKVLKLTQPNVSFHMRILREADLIEGKKDGKWTYYKLKNLPKEIKDMIENLDDKDLKEEFEKLKIRLTKKQGACEV